MRDIHSNGKKVKFVIWPSTGLVLALPAAYMMGFVSLLGGACVCQGLTQV